MASREALLVSILDRIADAAVWLFALVVVALFRLIDSTINLRISGYDHVAGLLRRSQPFLVVVWHGRGLLPIFFFQGLPLVVYSSQLRDAPLAGISRPVRRLTLAALRHLGYQVLDAAAFRSESRGVIRFLDLLERSRGGVIAADGPGGPIYQAKPGAAYVAKKTGVALVPVGAAMRDAIALDSWDRFEIPRPFTHGALAIGAPIEVPSKTDDAGLTRLSDELESVLNSLTVSAEAKASTARNIEAPRASPSRPR